MNRVKLPLVLKSAGYIYIASIFYGMKYYPEATASPSTITVISISALAAGFFVYGIICFIAAVRVGRTALGVQLEMKKNIDNAFKNKEAINPQEENESRLDNL